MFTKLKMAKEGLNAIIKFLSMLGKKWDEIESQMHKGIGFALVTLILVGVGCSLGSCASNYWIFERMNTIENRQTIAEKNDTISFELLIQKVDSNSARIERIEYRMELDHEMAKQTNENTKLLLQFFDRYNSVYR